MEHQKLWIRWRRINTQIKSKVQGTFFGYTLDHAFLLVFCKVSILLKINFWFITSSNLVFRMVTHVNVIYEINRNSDQYS
jgi:hypothetical protein